MESRLCVFKVLLDFLKYLCRFYFKSNEKILMVLNFEDLCLKRLFGRMDWIGVKIENSREIIVKDRRFWCFVLDSR